MTAPEYRIAYNLDRDGTYSIAELTSDLGLVSRIRGLKRWQAYAIMAVLDPADSGVCQVPHCNVPGVAAGITEK